MMMDFVDAHTTVPSMRPAELLHEALTGLVIGAFFEVYNTLGFGFLEHVYVLALELELVTAQLSAGNEARGRTASSLWSHSAVLPSGQLQLARINVASSSW